MDMTQRIDDAGGYIGGRGRLVPGAHFAALHQDDIRIGAADVDAYSSSYSFLFRPKLPCLPFR